MQRNFKVIFGDLQPEHRAYAQAALDIACLASGTYEDWPTALHQNARTCLIFSMATSEIARLFTSVGWGAVATMQLRGCK